MKAYRDITIRQYIQGSYDRATGKYMPGTDGEDEVVCGASDSESIMRNRNEEGANRTITKTFWLFVTSWGEEDLILDGGFEYRTQNKKQWPGFVEVVGMAEIP